MTQEQDDRARSHWRHLYPDLTDEAVADLMRGVLPGGSAPVVLLTRTDRPWLRVAAFLRVDPSLTLEQIAFLEQDMANRACVAAETFGPPHGPLAGAYTKLHEPLQAILAQGRGMHDVVASSYRLTDRGDPVDHVETTVVTLRRRVSFKEDAFMARLAQVRAYAPGADAATTGALIRLLDEMPSPQHSLFTQVVQANPQADARTLLAVAVQVQLEGRPVRGRLGPVDQRRLLKVSAQVDDLLDMSRRSWDWFSQAHFASAPQVPLSADEVAARRMLAERALADSGGPARLVRLREIYGDLVCRFETYLDAPALVSANFAPIQEFLGLLVTCQDLTDAGDVAGLLDCVSQAETALEQATAQARTMGFSYVSDGPASDSILREAPLVARLSRTVDHPSTNEFDRRKAAAHLGEVVGRLEQALGWAPGELTALAEARGAGVQPRSITVAAARPAPAPARASTRTPQGP